MRLNRYSFLTLLAAALFLLPQVASAQSLAGGPVMDAPVYFDTRGGGGIVLTQSTADFLDVGGVSCGATDGTYTTENGYFRAFDLSENDDVTDDLTVTSVDLGVGPMKLNDNESVTTTIRFHSITILNDDGSFLLADATLIGEQDVEITAADAETLKNIEVSGITLEDDEIFAFEWFVPSGDPADSGLDTYFDIRYAANEFEEDGPTLLQSESCGLTDPATLESLGNPDLNDLHWVLNVNATLGVVSNEDGATAREISLGTNFPNPVISGTTSIPFTLEAAQNVTVAVFDALGREVLSTSSAFAAGQQSVQVDLSAVPNGVYFYRLTAGDTTQTRKMTVVQ